MSKTGLSHDEAELVLDDMRKHYDEQVWNYFEFAFFTGLRPEEQIALRWSDLDTRLNTIRIQRAKTFKGSVKAPKYARAARCGSQQSRSSSTGSTKETHFDDRRRSLLQPGDMSPLAR